MKFWVSEDFKIECFLLWIIIKCWVIIDENNLIVNFYYWLQLFLKLKTVISVSGAQLLKHRAKEENIWLYKLSSNNE